MKLWNVLRRILKLLNCEKVGRETDGAGSSSGNLHSAADGVAGLGLASQSSYILLDMYARTRRYNTV